MNGKKQDPEKKEIAEQLLAYGNTFLQVVSSGFATKGDIETEIG